MLGWNAIYEHVGLGRDDSRVDEAQEKEASNKGADGIIGSFWVFALETVS